MPPASDSAATVPLVQAAFKLVDIIAATGGWGIGKGSSGKNGVGLGQSLRPETRTKLRAIREKLDKELKEETVKDQREEAELEKAAAKKKAEEERLSKLSAADQKKVRDSLSSPCVVFTNFWSSTQELERERKRMIRKTQGKVKSR